MGRFITVGLFIDATYTPETAIYTLQDEDMEYKGKTYQSLKRAFIEYGDPRGYYFAKHFFYNYAHYKRCVDSLQIGPVIQSWIEELELEIQADALKQLIKHSRSDKGQASAKWLATRGWVPKRGAGAPTKAERMRALKYDDKLAGLVGDDYERVTSHKVH